MGDSDEYASKKKRRTGWDQGPSTVSEGSSNPLASCKLLSNVFPEYKCNFTFVLFFFF